jgi:LuxR family maltose regulon positive regulatory protein
MVDDESRAALQARAGRAPEPTETPLRDPERLLAARFAVPARPDGFVDRPRLAARLDLGTSGPLTLISAPAGTGKTVAAAAWASRGHFPGLVVWISLDGGDLASPELWALVVEGLRRKRVAVPLRAPAAGIDPRDRTFLTALAVQIESHPEPIVIVLDCDGPLRKPDAAALDQLLRRVGGRLRLVLLTRADPLLPLHRYRLANSLVEIRMADLAFTTDEAAQLLSGKGVDLPPATTDYVTGRTQGWAAGLILTAMSLAHRTDPEESAKDLTGDTGAVAEYLLAEVLDAQPPAARALMLDTSIVDVIRPGLAEVLAGPHAPRALTFLAHGNAFLEEVPETAGCYRYHPLFRDLLRAQLWYEAPARALELHRRAAGWMAENGLVPEAVRHAVAAEAWEDAARYVVDDLAIGQLMVEHPAGPLAETLARIPADAEGAALSLVRAALAVATSDAEGCAVRLSEAGRVLAAGGAAADPAIQLALGLLRLVHAGATANAAAALDAADAVERLLPRQDPARLSAHPEVEVLVGLCRGFALLRSGQLDAAADALAAGAAAPTRPGCECLSIHCLGHLALVSAWDGRLRRAAELAERVMEVEADAGLASDTCPSAGETALAWVASEMYDNRHARYHLQRAAETGPSSRDPMQQVMLAIVGARMHRAAGDLAGAKALLAEAETEATVPSWLADRLRIEGATLDIRSGSPERACEVVEQMAEPTTPEAELVLAEARLARGEELGRPVPTPSAQRGSLTARVDGWLLEAWRRLRRGEELGATRALDRSLRLAAPERIRRPFREAPRDVRQLLRQHEELTSQHAWLGAEPTGTASPIPRQVGHDLPARSEPALVVEPLTEKEREVLGHLAELLTTEEIAAAMFVSVNTVRTHVRNILRKMSSSRRNEAVRRARELGIIPGPPNTGSERPS